MANTGEGPARPPTTPARAGVSDSESEGGAAMPSHRGPEWQGRAGKVPAGGRVPAGVGTGAHRPWLHGAATAGEGPAQRLPQQQQQRGGATPAGWASLAAGGAVDVSRDTSRLGQWGSSVEVGQGAEVATERALLPAWVWEEPQVAPYGPGASAVKAPVMGMPSSPLDAQRMLDEWRAYNLQCRHQGGLPVTIDTALQARLGSGDGLAAERAQFRGAARSILEAVEHDQGAGAAEHQGVPPMRGSWSAPLADAHYLLVLKEVADSTVVERRMGDLHQVLNEVPPPGRAGGWASLVADVGLVYSWLEKAYPGVRPENFKPHQQVLIRDHLIRRLPRESARELLSRACRQDDRGDAPLRAYSATLQQLKDVLGMMLAPDPRDSAARNDRAPRERGAAWGQAPDGGARRPSLGGGGWVPGRGDMPHGLGDSRENTPMRAFTVREQYGRDGGAREWGRGARPHEWDGAEFGDAEHDGRREGGDDRNYINDNKDYDGRRADGNDRNYINDNKDYDGSANGYPHHDYGYDEPNRRDDQRDDRRGSDMGARPQRAAWGASGRPAPSVPPPPSQDGGGFTETCWECHKPGHRRRDCPTWTARRRSAT